MSDQVQEKVEDKDDEISILDLIAILWKYKWFIIIFTCLAAIGIFMYCLISIKMPVDKSYMPNLYKPKAEMLINDGSSASSLSSALANSGLGNIAGLMGVSVGGGKSNSALASYMVTSFTVQDAIIEKFYKEEVLKAHTEAVEKLIKKGRYKPEDDKWVFPLTAMRITLTEKIKSRYDSSTGVFTIEVEDKDPQLACDIINFTVDLLEKRFSELGVDKNKLAEKNLEDNIDTAYNNIITLRKQIQQLELSVSNPYARSDISNVAMDTTMLKMELDVQEKLYASLKAQYESLKITMASEQPVFQILEYAEIPDMKSGPSRGKLCIIVTFAAFFVSVFLTFLLNAVENIKKDPVAMKKLKGNKK